MGLSQRQRLILWSTVAGALAIALLFAGDLVAWMFEGNRAPDRPQLAFSPPLMRIVPSEADLGAVSPCGDMHDLSQPATIINDASVPLRVVHWSPSCGCTVSDLPEEFTVAPGESIAFTARVDPWGSWGDRTQSIQLMVDEAGLPVRPGPKILLRYSVGGDMHPAPGVVRRVLRGMELPAQTAGETPGAPRLSPDGGQTVLASEDGSAFEVTGSDPPTESIEWHDTPIRATLTWGWEDIDTWAAENREMLLAQGRAEYDPDGRWVRARATVSTSREGCTQVVIMLVNVEADGGGTERVPIFPAPTLPIAESH